MINSDFRKINTIVRKCCGRNFVFLKQENMHNNVQFVQITVADLTSLIQKTISEEVSKVIQLLPSKVQSNEPELLSRKETMELLGKSYPYLWRLNKLGVLKSRKMGRSVFYFKEDIFNYLSRSAD